MGTREVTYIVGLFVLAAGFGFKRWRYLRSRKAEKEYQKRRWGQTSVVNEVRAHALMLPMMCKLPCCADIVSCSKGCSKWGCVCVFIVHLSKCLSTQSAGAG